MHYIIIIGIILFIVIVQIRSFLNTQKKILIYLKIFPEGNDKYKLNKSTLLNTINSAKDEDLIKMLETAGFDVHQYFGTEQPEIVSDIQKTVPKKNEINTKNKRTNLFSVNDTIDTKIINNELLLFSERSFLYTSNIKSGDRGSYLSDVSINPQDNTLYKLKLLEKDPSQAYITIFEHAHDLILKNMQLLEGCEVDVDGNTCISILREGKAQLNSNKKWLLIVPPKIIIT
jgi:hypothetical protein